MTQLYITDSSAKIGYRENQITVYGEKCDSNSFSIENVDGVAISGMPHLSTSFLRKMLDKKLDLQFFNQEGHYIGRLISPESISPQKQQLQVNKTADIEFRLAITKQIISSKICNQMHLLKAYC